MLIISISISCISLLIFIYTLLFVRDFMWWSGNSESGQHTNVNPTGSAEILFRTFFTIFFIPIILWIITYFVKRNSIITDTQSESNEDISNNEIKKKTNKVASWGFGLSLVSMLTGLGLLGYISMTCGIIGLIQIKKSKQKGKGLAITAIVIGTLYGIVMSLVHIMVMLGY